MDAIKASDVRRRDALLQAWLKDNKTNSYRAEDLPAHIVPPTNEERSECEVFEFNRDRPEKYFTYVKLSRDNGAFGCTVTTWMGNVLGHGRVGSEYRSNMGDKRRSIWITAITGDKYAGTFFCGAGDYARIRKVKG